MECHSRTCPFVDLCPNRPPNIVLPPPWLDALSEPGASPSRFSHLGVESFRKPPCSHFGVDAVSIVFLTRCAKDWKKLSSSETASSPKVVSAIVFEDEEAPISGARAEELGSGETARELLREAEDDDGFSPALRPDSADLDANPRDPKPTSSRSIRARPSRQPPVP